MPCEHPNAVTVRSGSRRPDEEVVDYEGAWCPDCGAYRDSSATSDPEAWDFPGLLKHAGEVPIAMASVQDAIDRGRRARSAS